jgi:long-chain fatty acid transport protein
VKTYRSPKVLRFLSLIPALGLVCAPRTVLALGIALPDQDAFATARGNAFVATADDPAAVFYNPAGITQLEGMNTSIGAYGIVYGDTYHNGSTSIDSKTQLAVLPQFFSTWNLPKYNLAFGLGTYSPYGLRMEWPNTAPFAGIGETGQINYYTLNPVVAYQLLPSLSIAAGPTFNYSEADLKEYPGFVNHFRGRDTAAGYTAGILWHPTPRNSLGVTYRSSTDMNYQGHATVPIPPFTANTAASANFHFPETVSFGYSFRPTTNWNFEADADWSDWSTLRTVNVSPLGESIPFNWQPSWILDAGVTRYLGDGWRVSGGYMYSINSVPEADFNPLIPDSDRHIFSLGVGKKYARFSWDIAYQLAWGPSRTINDDTLGSPPYPSSPANGRYQFLSHAITINFGYRF